MFDRDRLPYGASLGLLFPLLGLGLAWLLAFLWESLAQEGGVPPVRERTLVLLAICLNLIPFRAFNRRRAMHSLRGVVTVTVLWAFAWIILYFKELTA
jgi:fatty acid desaturase